MSFLAHLSAKTTALTFSFCLRENSPLRRVESIALGVRGGATSITYDTVPLSFVLTGSYEGHVIYLVERSTTNNKLSLLEQKER